MQVTRQIPDFRKLVLSDETQKDGLQYVFCVAGIAGDAVCGPEYQFPVLQKNLLQPQPEIVSGHGSYVLLRNLHCGLQFTTVLLWLHRRENNPVINGTLKLIIVSALPGIVTAATWRKFPRFVDSTEQAP